MINHSKRGRVNQLKELYEDFGEEEETKMWKDDYIEKLTQIFLNKIYYRRLEMIVSCFSTNPEGASRLKEMIPRICHEETITPEENLRELFTIFNRPRFLTRIQTFQMEIVKITKFYKFLFKKIAKITVKRYLYSLDGDDDDDDFDTWIMSRSFKFREFPIIPDPDRGVVWWKSYNIYNCFKSEFRQCDDGISHCLNSEYHITFRQCDDGIVLEMLLRQIENKTKVITKKFNDEADEEAKEPVTCKICLVNTPKVAFTSCCHCACFSCADKLKDCHICRKKINFKKD